MLTDGQRLAYLKDPTQCPHCGSDDLDGEITESDYDGSYRQQINCLACGASWVDVFTLTAVEDVEEGEEP